MSTVRWSGRVVRRWLAEHPLIDGLCRLAIFGCFGVGLVGGVIAWRGGAAIPQWVFLAYIAAFTLMLLRGGAGKPRA